MNFVEWKRFELKYVAEDDLHLPVFKGATLRGSFGLTFKRVVCPVPNGNCRRCKLRESCPYLYVFDTPIKRGSAIMRKYTNAPHPFIIEPPDDERTLVSRGENLIFGLVLIGKAIEYLPHFIYTFMRVGKQGIGKGRGKARLTQVLADGIDILNGKKVETSYFEIERLLFDTTIDTNDVTSKLRLRFPFPVRIEQEGKLWGAEIRPEFGILARNLFRRLSLLSYFHCGGTPEYPFEELLPIADSIKLKEWELKPITINRYSRRQRKKTPLKGVVGTVTYTEIPKALNKYLQAAKFLHVGKNTSFGFGKLILEIPVNMPEEEWFMI